MSLIPKKLLDGFRGGLKKIGQKKSSSKGELQESHEEVSEAKPRIIEGQIVENSKFDNIGERLDRDSVPKNGVWNEDFRNRKFDDLNANQTKFVNCDFSYCIFVRGYFHKTSFENCSFLGCRFYDCNFREARFNSCDFRYSNFHNCLVPALEVIPNLPPQPNLRRDVLQVLKANAAQVGDREGAKRYTSAEIAATYDHIKRALKSEDHYYKEKYPSSWDKIALVGQLVGHGLSGFLWGHGERPFRLLISVFVVIVVGSFINLFSLPASESMAPIDYVLTALRHTFEMFLGISGEAGKGGFLLIDYIVVIARYIYIGLFISVLAKFISFR